MTLWNSRGTKSYKKNHLLHKVALREMQILLINNCTSHKLYAHFSRIQVPDSQLSFNTKPSKFNKPIHHSMHTANINHSPTVPIMVRTMVPLVVRMCGHKEHVVWKLKWKINMEFGGAAVFPVGTCPQHVPFCPLPVQIAFSSSGGGDMQCIVSDIIF